MVVLGKLREDDKAQYAHILQTNTERRWGLTTDILWQLPLPPPPQKKHKKTESTSESVVHIFQTIFTVLTWKSWFCCKSYYRFTASSKASSPQSAICAAAFNLQYPLVSLTSDSSCLRLLPRLLVPSTLPFIFPSIACFRRQHLTNPEETKTMLYLWKESHIRPYKRFTSCLYFLIVFSPEGGLRSQNVL